MGGASSFFLPLTKIPTETPQSVQPTHENISPKPYLYYWYSSNILIKHRPHISLETVPAVSGTVEYCKKMNLFYKSEQYTQIKQGILAQFPDVRDHNNTEEICGWQIPWGKIELKNAECAPVRNA
jgi:hypothetical protein